MSKYSSMSWAEVRSIAKERGINARQTRENLEAALLEWDGRGHDPGDEHVESTPPETDMVMHDGTPISAAMRAMLER